MILGRIVIRTFGVLVKCLRLQLDRTDFDAVSTIIAKTHRIGVMASLAFEITAVKEDYQSVSGAVNAGKGQYFIDNCLLRVHD